VYALALRAHGLAARAIHLVALSEGSRRYTASLQSRGNGLKSALPLWAFTLIELLVVTAIIAPRIAAVAGVGEGESKAQPRF